MASKPSLIRRTFRMLARVFPRCGMISQAIAFNLFLAFFPALLIMVGFATSRIGGRTSLLDLITDLTAFLPPGSQGIVSEFLVKRGPEAWKLALVGWTGTLLAGSQVMRLLMEGIHRIYGDQEKPGFLHRQLRGLVLLLVTIAPLLAAAILGVLGRPIRRWLADELGPHHPLQGWWTFFFPAAAIVLAMLALTVIYRVARPGEESLRNVLPGAMVATSLWWLVNVLFGFYVRRVPYNVVYGGLAAVIGLMVWMQLSAVIIFLGAAWNAELDENRRGARLCVSDMAEQVVRVECYSGHKADERPLRIVFETQTWEIAEVEDRWYSPGLTYFRVLTESGDRYVLRRDDAQDVWSLTAFRAAGKRVDTKIN